MIERTWVSQRTPQQVGQQQFALGLKARFKPCRDSAACTTVIRLQSKLPELLFRRRNSLILVSRHSLCPCPHSLRPFSSDRRIGLQSQTEELTPRRKKFYLM